MIQVSLLGDSICLSGYGKMVPVLLGEKYQVFMPDDNAGFPNISSGDCLTARG